MRRRVLVCIEFSGRQNNSSLRGPAIIASVGKLQSRKADDGMAEYLDKLAEFARDFSFPRKANGETDFGEQVLRSINPIRPLVQLLTRMTSGWVREIEERAPYKSGWRYVTSSGFGASVGFLPVHKSSSASLGLGYQTAEIVLERPYPNSANGAVQRLSIYPKFKGVGIGIGLVEWGVIGVSASGSMKSWTSEGAVRLLSPQDLEPSELQGPIVGCVFEAGLGVGTYDLAFCIGVNSATIAAWNALENAKYNPIKMKKHFDHMLVELAEVRFRAAIICTGNEATLPSIGITIFRGHVTNSVIEEEKSNANAPPQLPPNKRGFEVAPGLYYNPHDPFE